MDKLNKHLQNLKVNNNYIAYKDLCKICYTEKTNSILICGHMYCYNCSLLILENSDACIFCKKNR